ncbi:hypothetical protein [Hymenobacter yonginensis]|uniref:Uncharacterized protein n=1 Tax=Hymenobacter yonginensis TaxID=748197 RepID=A0ABY7PTN0_9BACT|nr:hypothetical protein [Hymenobacter yonginensis]WBO86275.1 hypothetical protein O9Z63_08430 [Hymenobacter yonginensis]
MEEQAVYSAPPYRLIAPLAQWLSEQGYVVEVYPLFVNDDTHLGLTARLVFASGNALRFLAEATPELLQCKLNGVVAERLEHGFGWLRVSSVAQIQWLLAASAFQGAAAAQPPGPPSVAHGWLVSRCPEWD